MPAYRWKRAGGCLITPYKWYNYFEKAKVNRGQSWSNFTDSFWVSLWIPSLGNCIYVYQNATMHHYLVATFTSALKSCVSGNPNLLLSLLIKQSWSRVFQRTPRFFPLWDPHLVLITSTSESTHRLRTCISFPMQFSIVLVRRKHGSGTNFCFLKSPVNMV